MDPNDDDEERERLKSSYSTQHDLKITKRGSCHGDKKVLIIIIIVIIIITSSSFPLFSYNI